MYFSGAACCISYNLWVTGVVEYYPFLGKGLDPGALH